MAKPIMLQGTMSSAGKSVIAAALCRIFAQDGFKTAPFKSQNMALNSYITEDGLEMGRAQAVQAEAAGIKPSALMNPILLKPTSDVGSQVIVNGEVRTNMRAADYFKYKTKLIPDIMNAYSALSAEYDIIVIEGAGSPAEINLKENDIVNMGLAKLTNAPVFLVGDIDRGGVFAQLYGTAELLESDEKARIKGLIINKFRGDGEILKPGLSMLEELTGIPVAGVIPYMNLDIDDEDSVCGRFEKRRAEAVDIAVIHFPRISNFTDFSAFELLDGVSVRYAASVRELGNPDMIILPGTKNTAADLRWMRENGLEAAVLKAASAGKVIFGVCGGYQMLGEEISDAAGAEGGGKIRGLGLLGSRTEFENKKTQKQVRGKFVGLTGTLKPLNGTEIAGYEIHMGKTELRGGGIIELSDGELCGECRGNIYGSYIHGLFDGCAAQIARCLCAAKGLDAGRIKNVSLAEHKEEQYNMLADTVRAGLNMDLIYRSMGL